jgi:hypothetical protein
VVGKSLAESGELGIEWGKGDLEAGQGNVSARQRRGSSGEDYEPFTSPFHSHRHVFVLGAKKAAEARVGEREYDER